MQKVHQKAQTTRATRQSHMLNKSQVTAEEPPLQKAPSAKLNERAHVTDKKTKDQFQTSPSEQKAIMDREFKIDVLIKKLNFNKREYKQLEKEYNDLMMMRNKHIFDPTQFDDE